MAEVFEQTTTTGISKIDYGVAKSELETKVKADLAITINGIEDKAGYKLADTRRKEWVKVRTSIDKRRKELNAEAKKHIENVNAVAKELTDIAAQAEDHVTKLVDGIAAAIAKAEQDKLDAIFNAKNDRLTAAGLFLPRILVDSMTDIEIDDKISEAVELARFRKAQAEKEAAEKAEADRKAAEQAEANRKEAERLAAERAEFARQQAELKAEQDRLAKIEADRLAAERAELDRQRREQEEQARLIREQQEAAQRKIDEENARLAKVEADRLAEIERQRLETEAAERAKLEVAAKAKRDAEAAAQAEQLRPDKEKLLAFADRIGELSEDVPKVAKALKPVAEVASVLLLEACRKVREMLA